MRTVDRAKIAHWESEWWVISMTGRPLAGPYSTEAEVMAAHADIHEIAHNLGLRRIEPVRTGEDGDDDD